ncbi:MAG: polysaccharide export protein [Candidatus Omnitrophica bacterium]|nr:polysaccharide export protein [Candidatus Omnitrophota bacterium]MBU1933024.1 polysaccharide export protein [Candidatus Omnitrophota bacterium]
MKITKIIPAVLILIFLILPYTNAAQVPQPAEPSEDVQKMLSQQVEQEPLKYTLGPDDVIQIDVRRHPEFSGEYAVNSEGKIQYKFVGDIPLAGLTKLEAKDKLTEILSKFIIDPDIDVIISQYRSKVIFIVGEVGAPGKYYMRADSVSVRDVIVQAGLPTLAAAMRKTRLVRPDEDGKPKYEVVDLYKLIYEGKLDTDREMLPGDVLYVPATLFAKITRIINPVAAPISPATTIERAATGGVR